MSTALDNARDAAERAEARLQQKDCDGCGGRIWLARTANGKKVPIERGEGASLVMGSDGSVEVWFTNKGATFHRLHRCPTHYRSLNALLKAHPEVRPLYEATREAALAPRFDREAHREALAAFCSKLQELRVTFGRPPSIGHAADWDEPEFPPYDYRGKAL